MRTLLAASLLLLGCAALPARAGEAPAQDPLADGWRFGLAVSGSWSRAWVELEEVEIRRSVVTFPGVLRSVRVGADRDELRPSGAGIEGELRAWAPLEILGGRPWLGAGYRQPLGDNGDGDTYVAAGPVAWSARFDLEFARAVTLRLGLDVPIAFAGRRVVLAPVLGADFAWFRAAIDSGPISLLGSPPVAVDTEFFGGLAAGLELRLPLVTRAPVTLDLSLGAVYTRYFGEGDIDTTATSPFAPGSPPLHNARYEPRDAVAVRLGLVLALF